MFLFLTTLPCDVTADFWAGGYFNRVGLVVLSIKRTAVSSADSQITRPD
jgi:hypothetical protein